MNGGQTVFYREGPVGFITFDRPGSRNAMTSEMYEQLREICDNAANDSELRLLVLRGAGGKAFIAGTEISQFKDFSTGEDGVRYELKMEEYLSLLGKLPIPTLAIVEGAATGGGLAVAIACDIRIASSSARFGIPIARTVGNTISMANHARLCTAFGVSRAKRMLITGEMIDSTEALQAGFLAAVAEPDNLEMVSRRMIELILGNAPLTIKASKKAFALLAEGQTAEEFDLIRLCYGSTDFKEGVSAFLDKRKPNWSGL